MSSHCIGNRHDGRGHSSTGTSNGCTCLTWLRRKPSELSGKDKIVDPPEHLQTPLWCAALPCFKVHLPRMFHNFKILLIKMLLIIYCSKENGARIAIYSFICEAMFASNSLEKSDIEEILYGTMLTIVATRVVCSHFCIK